MTCTYERMAQLVESGKVRIENGYLIGLRHLHIDLWLCADALLNHFAPHDIPLDQLPFRARVVIEAARCKVELETYLDEYAASHPVGAPSGRQRIIL